MKPERLLWLDVLKGIGIVAVVMGHVLDCRYVYAFHMPLFFLISGYTFHLRTSLGQYAKLLSQRFLVPYFVFLIVINVLTVCLYGFRVGFFTSLWGGQRLKGIFAAYWFITVLFGALLLFYVIMKQRKIRKRYCLLGLLAGAYALEWLNIDTPWDVAVTPMATCFLMVGYGFKQTRTTPPHSFVPHLANTFICSNMALQSSTDGYEIRTLWHPSSFLWCLYRLGWQPFLCVDEVGAFFVSCGLSWRGFPFHHVSPHVRLLFATALECSCKHGHHIPQFPPSPHISILSDETLKTSQPYFHGKGLKGSQC